MGEDDIEEVCEGVPEELTNELLKLEQEGVAGEEARGKETTGKEGKKKRPRKFTVKGLTEVFCRPQ